MNLIQVYFRDILQTLIYAGLFIKSLFISNASPSSSKPRDLECGDCEECTEKGHITRASILPPSSRSMLDIQATVEVMVTSEADNSSEERKSLSVEYAIERLPTSAIAPTPRFDSLGGILDASADDAQRHRGLFIGNPQLRDSSVFSPYSILVEIITAGGSPSTPTSSSHLPLSSSSHSCPVETRDIKMFTGIKPALEPNRPPWRYSIASVFVRPEHGDPSAQTSQATSRLISQSRSSRRFSIASSFPSHADSSSFAIDLSKANIESSRNRLSIATKRASQIFSATFWTDASNDSPAPIDQESLPASLRSKIDPPLTESWIARANEEWKREVIGGMNSIRSSQLKHQDFDFYCVPLSKSKSRISRASSVALGSERPVSSILSASPSHLGWISNPSFHFP